MLHLIAVNSPSKIGTRGEIPSTLGFFHLVWAVAGQGFFHLKNEIVRIL